MLDVLIFIDGGKLQTDEYCHLQCHREAEYEKTFTANIHSVSQIRT